MIVSKIWQCDWVENWAFLLVKYTFLCDWFRNQCFELIKPELSHWTLLSFNAEGKHIKHIYRHEERLFPNSKSSASILHTFLIFNLSLSLPLSVSLYQTVFHNMFLLLINFSCISFWNYCTTHICQEVIKNLSKLYYTVFELYFYHEFWNTFHLNAKLNFMDNFYSNFTYLFTMLILLEYLFFHYNIWLHLNP